MTIKITNDKQILNIDKLTNELAVKNEEKMKN
jgi:hypothetical protein